MKPVLTTLLTGCLVLAITYGDALAQATAQISGAVQDQSGAVLPGVEVAATQRGRGLIVPGEIVHDRQPRRIAEAIQHHRQLDLFSGGVHQGAAHVANIAMGPSTYNVQYLLNIDSSVRP